jgi:hypothetical protein
MMNMKRKILVQVLLVTTVLGVFNSCKESFLEVNPQGPLASENLANKPGVEAALIGAYAMLDGYHINDNNTWAADPVNWILGSVTTDDAYKGSEQGDMAEATQIELYQWSPSNIILNQKYVPLYEGVTRTNAVLRLVEIAEGVEDIRDRVRGEALFLRAYYHFELYKVFGNIVYLTETDTDFPRRTRAVTRSAMLLPILKKPSRYSLKHKVTKDALTRSQLKRSWVNFICTI